MIADFYTSDPHFWHRNQAERRGFAAAEEHDAVIVDNINKAARAGDRLWLLGDVGLGYGAGATERILGRVAELAADVHLILGNHDAPHPEHRGSVGQLQRWQASGVFASIQLADCHRLAGHRVMLSHFPYQGDHTEKDRAPCWRLRDEGRLLIHGHVHQPWKVRGRGIHVGLDAWDLKPVPRPVLEKLIAAEFGPAGQADE